MSSSIDTEHAAVAITTHLGTITIGPGKQIKGLWPIVQRELITAETVRNIGSGQKTKPITRTQLARWRAKRTHPLPAPVVTLQGSGPGGAGVELWSRTAVKAWVREHRRRIAARAEA